jgi:hypothetical protein
VRHDRDEVVLRAVRRLGAFQQLRLPERQRRLIGQRPDPANIVVPEGLRTAQAGDSDDATFSIPVMLITSARHVTPEIFFFLDSTAMFLFVNLEKRPTDLLIMSIHEPVFWVDLPALMLL